MPARSVTFATDRMVDTHIQEAKYRAVCVQTDAYTNARQDLSEDQHLYLLPTMEGIRALRHTSLSQSPQRLATSSIAQQCHGHRHR